MELTAKMVIEILGGPKEHVEETLKIILQKLKEEEEVELIKSTTDETEK